MKEEMERSCRRDENGKDRRVLEEMKGWILLQTQCKQSLYSEYPYSQGFRHYSMTLAYTLDLVSAFCIV